jgi:hypothetical protein
MDTVELVGLLMGVHAFNYADFPLSDLLLGSFRNPKAFDGRCGFEAPADRRLGAMLRFVDVNLPLYRHASRGAQPRPQSARVAG